MAIITENDLKIILWDVVDNFLIPKFNKLGMKASGQWLDALNVKVDSSNGKIQGQIWGADYTQYLVNGRRPGKRPPISVLESWVNNKFGIYGTEAKSMAFAIANKIAKEGTEYYPQGTDLLEVLQSKECTDYINSKLSDYYVKSVSLQFTRILKSIK